jgi:hypothetical protein
MQRFCAHFWNLYGRWWNGPSLAPASGPAPHLTGCAERRETSNNKEYYDKKRKHGVAVRRPARGLQPPKAMTAPELGGPDLRIKVNQAQSRSIKVDQGKKYCFRYKATGRLRGGEALFELVLDCKNKRYSRQAIWADGTARARSIPAAGCDERATKPAGQRANGYIAYFCNPALEPAGAAAALATTDLRPKALAAVTSGLRGGRLGPIIYQNQIQAVNFT